MSIPRSAEERIPTAELPKPEVTRPEPEPLTKQELELSTADTRPLPPEMRDATHPVQANCEEPTAEEPKAEEPIADEWDWAESPVNKPRAAEPLPAELYIEEPEVAEAKPEEPAMDNKFTPTANTVTEMKTGSSGPLLDLGYFEPAHAAAEEEFVLDLDLPGGPESADTSGAIQSQPFSLGSFAGAGVGTHAETSVIESTEAAEERSSAAPVAPTVDPMAQTQEMMRPVISAAQSEPEKSFTEPAILEAETLRMTAPMLESTPSGPITANQLSPEAIDAIARRAVEMLSERAVQEIAWEVVPQLAELLIKRQLEEKNS